MRVSRILTFRSLPLPRGAGGGGEGVIYLAFIGRGQISGGDNRFIYDPRAVRAVIGRINVTATVRDVNARHA